MKRRMPTPEKIAPTALPDAYVAAAKGIAAIQLERAGVRLAAVLNRNLE